MRLMLVISSLSPGGAERVMSILANSWAAAGHTVTLVTLASDPSSYDIAPAVTRVTLGAMGRSRTVWDGLTANGKRILQLRRQIRRTRPDAIVSFVDRTNVRVLLAAAGSGVPVIVSERIDPRTLSPGAAWSWIRRHVYQLASQVVVQTESVRGWAETFLDTGRVSVIPNPIDPAFAAPAARARSAMSAREPLIAAIGRLVPQKGFDLLIEAFAAARGAAPDWSLVIAGSGPDEKALRDRAERLGVADAVIFAGHLSRPQDLLQRAAIFALSSRFEGFPNVLLEAMASGCAVVATDCPSGPSDIVTNGRDGLLVAACDAAALADGLRTLMGDAALRARLAAAAEASTARFTHTAVLQQWDRLLGSVQPSTARHAA